MVNDYFKRLYPRYYDDSNYNTNAPSYYDDLARKHKLIELLAKRIWEYDEELAKRFEAWDKNLEDFPEDVKVLLRLWVEDGTMGLILNEELLNNKADIITSVDEPTHVTEKTYWYQITDSIEFTIPSLDGNISYDILGG